MKPFHQWKVEFVAADSAAHGVFLKFSEREFYYHTYGIYCNRVRHETLPRPSHC